MPKKMDHAAYQRGLRSRTPAERKDALERLMDDFHEWKSIYGSQVPAGYSEPKDRAEVRKKFIADIAKLRE
jgi:hypothetical protein